MTINNFIDEVIKLGIEIDDDKLNKLNILTNELILYNKNTNLTRITEINEIYLKHYYDSLTIVKVINLNNINNLIDIGTGAGFPGLIISIFNPNINVTLLDSNNKKIKWLEYISKKLNLNVTIINSRVEDYSKDNLNKFDVVTSRAVANLRVLSELCLPLVKNNGYFIPLKSSIDVELNEAKKTLDYFNVNIIKIEKFYLYNNDNLRNVLLIQKNSLSKLSDIRNYDKIIKKSI